MPLLSRRTEAKVLNEDYYFTCDDLTPDLCDLEVTPGHVDINGISVAYWIYKSKTTTPHDHDHDHADDPETNKKLPIMVLHGGLGVPHYYMLPHKQLACRGRTVVFYDQAGCGQSRYNGTSIPEWLLDPLYYSTIELPAMLDHLRSLFDEGFHILANSVGSLQAQFYALDATHTTLFPQLTSMALSGPFSDSQTYIQAQWDPIEGNLGTLPLFMQQRIRVLEAAGAFDSPEYQIINQDLTAQFSLRTEPAPDCVMQAVELSNTDIYLAMNGPSEFAMHGVLAKVNLTGRLDTIDVPVFLLHGKYDQMRPSIVKTMQSQLPYAERMCLERAGHVSMVDEPGPMNDAIADFFDRVEQAQQKVAAHHNHGHHDRHGNKRNAILHEMKTMAAISSKKDWPKFWDNPQEGTSNNLEDSLVGYSVLSAGGMPAPAPEATLGVMVIACVVSTAIAMIVGYMIGNYQARRNMRRHYMSLEA